jgi:hypothetical protein
MEYYKGKEIFRKFGMITILIKELAKEKKYFRKFGMKEKRVGCGAG